MVLDEETLMPLHEMTEEGKQKYREYLEYRADEILFKNEHPLKYLWNYIRNMFHISYVEDDYTDYMM